MFTLEDKSKLISDFEEIYKFRKMIDKKFYKKCKKKCKKADMTQLKHAKSVLEEKKVQAGGNDYNNSQIFVIAPIIISMIVLLSDFIRSFEITKLNVSTFFLDGIGCMLILVIFIISSVNRAIKKPIRRRNAYYYSIICDEIEKREKTDQNI